MAESKVNRENYIVLQGFMLTDLKLKGNELVIYACIYGFSQAENQVFNGSLQYLADWTNSTKQGVVKSLKSLVEKGYIQKTEKYINGVKFCEYYATKFNTPMQQSLTGGIKQSLPNNKDINNISNNKEIYIAVCDCLNRYAKTNYKASSAATQRLINARISEGFTVEDFETVIKKKCAEWKGSEMEKYLRPETLFGTKFENYLNAKQTAEKPKATSNFELTGGLNL